jgi:predicted RNase H-like HicB family nuclease
MHLKVVYEPSEEGGYTVFVPALPGCVSEGESLDEARANILEAIALYLEETEPAPAVPKGVVVEEITL